jgi:phosphoglycerate dehydrogenase-like enzyme
MRTAGRDARRRRAKTPALPYTRRVSPKRLVIAADIEPNLVALLRGDPRFEVSQDDARSEEALAALLGDAEIVVTRTYNRVSDGVLAASPRLRLIAQGTSGVDNIDVEASARRGVAVLSLPGVNANAVAELVIGNLIALTRTVPLYTRQMHGGQWKRGDCTSRHELRHYPLGIVGLGKVGTRVAQLAAAFGMHVQAVDPYLSDSDFRDRAAERVASLPELLAGSDIVTLHVPLTSETRRMIGAPQMAAMRPGSFLVNASRGEVLDLDAALEALGSGHLGGLAVDVFDPEPPQRSFPDHPRLILTPHIAGCTWEAKNNAGELLYQRIVEWAETTT